MNFITKMSVTCFITISMCLVTRFVADGENMSKEPRELQALRIGRSMLGDMPGNQTGFQVIADSYIYDNYGNLGYQATYMAGESEDQLYFSNITKQN